MIAFSVSTSLQDSDDEANDEDDTLEKPAMKKEFSHRSPSPPAEDSEPEMTEEEKEFQLVCAVKIIFLLLLHMAYRVWFLKQCTLILSILDDGF